MVANKKMGGLKIHCRQNFCNYASFREANCGILRWFIFSQIPLRKIFGLLLFVISLTLRRRYKYLVVGILFGYITVSCRSDSDNQKSGTTPLRNTWRVEPQSTIQPIGSMGLVLVTIYLHLFDLDLPVWVPG